ncbi:outer membrane beta-barrel protein [Ferrimonas gelatinilytica]|uniref:Outer membrane beta-barrel protein n=1 Tax=Ferrimonas gelatinilytica TaxID=1255257 RepID=A0ABP9SD52_9GAMM
MAAEFEPAIVEITEDLSFRPILALDLGHDDNLLNRGDQKISSAYIRVEPDLQFSLGERISHLRFGYRFNGATYFDSSADNYGDHHLFLTGHHEFTARHAVDLDYRFAKAHEDRGTGLAEFFILPDPVRYTENTLDLGYRFGADQARMQLAVRAGLETRSHDNFEFLTQFRDFDRYLAGLELSWRLGQRTRFVLDGEYEDKSYDRQRQGSASRDSESWTVLAGLTWKATEKTEGRLKLGYQDKSFSDPVREDFSGLSWDIDLFWSPMSRSRWEFSSSSEAKDPSTTGDYVEERVYRIQWRHHWLQRLASVIEYRFENDEYTGLTRSEDYQIARLGVIYHFRRWIQFEPYVDVRDRSSNLDNPSVNYDKTRFGLATTLSL